MHNNINIKINGLNDNTSLKVVDSLKDIIKQFSYLDFRRLSKIVITSNFQRDVDRLSQSNKIGFENKYKANKDTYAVVLTIPKDDDFELVLVMKSNFAKSITSKNDEQEYKNALHVLNHEFAHIHDNNKKIDVFKQLMKTKTYKGKDSILFPIAETCWSEYIANFISSQSALNTQYPKLVAITLLEKIYMTQQNIKTSLMAYKINHKREDLVENSIVQIETLLKTASYLIGYLNGMQITLAELDDEIDLKIESSYFNEFWSFLKHELASIHQVYPHGFVNLNIYKNLAILIDNFYKEMGIIFDEDKKGRIQIHII